MRTAARRAVVAVPGVLWCTSVLSAVLVWLLALAPVRSVVALVWGAAAAAPVDPKDSPRTSARRIREQPPLPGTAAVAIGDDRDYLDLEPLPSPAGASSGRAGDLEAGTAAGGGSEAATNAAAGSADGKGAGGEGRRVASDSNAEPFQVELAGLPPNAPTLVTAELVAQIRQHLPVRLWITSTWTAIFSTYAHGMSLHTLVERAHGYNGPTLLVVRDKGGATFGGFCSAPWTADSMFHGTGESFVWKLLPNGALRVYPWSRANDYFMIASVVRHESYLAMGGGDGRYALWLDDELRLGHSSPSLTFRNEPLASSADFECVALELWGVADDVHMPEMRWRRAGQLSMATLASGAASDLHRPPGAPLVNPDSTASPLIVPSVSTVLPFGASSSSGTASGGGSTGGHARGSPLAAKNR